MYVKGLQRERIYHWKELSGRCVRRCCIIAVNVQLFENQVWCAKQPSYMWILGKEEIQVQHWEDEIEAIEWYSAGHRILTRNLSRKWKCCLGVWTNQLLEDMSWLFSLAPWGFTVDPRMSSLSAGSSIKEAFFYDLLEILNQEAAVIFWCTRDFAQEFSTYFIFSLPVICQEFNIWKSWHGTLILW